MRQCEVRNLLWLQRDHRGRQKGIFTSRRTARLQFHARPRIARLMLGPRIEFTGDSPAICRAIAWVLRRRSGGIRSRCFWPVGMSLLNAPARYGAAAHQHVRLRVLDSTTLAPAQPDRVAGSTYRASGDVEEAEPLAG